MLRASIPNPKSRPKMRRTRTNALPSVPSNNRAPLPFSEPLTHPALLSSDEALPSSLAARWLVPTLRSNLRLDKTLISFSPLHSAAAAMATDGRGGEREGRKGEGGGGNGSAVHKRGGSLLDVLKDEGGRACVRVPRVGLQIFTG